MYGANYCMRRMRSTGAFRPPGLAAPVHELRDLVAPVHEHASSESLYMMEGADARYERCCICLEGDDVLWCACCGWACHPGCLADYKRHCGMSVCPACSRLEPKLVCGTIVPYSV